MGKYKNNYVKIQGRIVEEFKFYKCEGKEVLYSSLITIRRGNGVNDTLILVIPDNLLKYGIKDTFVELIGQFRSFNELGSDGKSHLKLYVYSNIIKYDYEIDDTKDANFIRLKGFICKPPKLRETPLGTIISDIHLAVNRSKYKSDYIPCIAWGENAMSVAELKVGDEIEIYGRIQSRDYIKKHPTYEELKVAYEVSINRIR